jgi:phosphonate transport system substrate-binding protein
MIPDHRLLAWLILLWSCGWSAHAEPATVRGSAGSPLRVLILPVDGGTADGTLADYKPSFDAVTRFSGLQFDVNVGQS